MFYVHFVKKVLWHEEESADLCYHVDSVKTCKNGLVLSNLIYIKFTQSNK